MSKYTLLTTLRNKYWQQLQAADTNYTNVLIALETVNLLPVEVCKDIIEFDRLWEGQMEEAKVTLNEIYKEAVGFKPFKVLNMVREIQKFRCLFIRTDAVLYGKLSPLELAMGLAEKSWTDGSVPDDWKGKVRSQSVNFFRAHFSQIAHMTGQPTGAEYNAVSSALLGAIGDSIEKDNGGIATKTARQMDFEEAYMSSVLKTMFNIYGVYNNLNFKRFNKEISMPIRMSIMKHIKVPDDKAEALAEAMFELVEE